MIERTRIRRKKGAKRLELSDLRDAVADRRTWVALGVVYIPENADKHYQLVVEDGAVTDVLVEVQTVPDGQDLTCRLAAGFGAGAGLWYVPPVGTEVAVVVPSGAHDFQPMIVGAASSGGAPAVAGRVTLVCNEPLDIIAPAVNLGAADASHPVAFGDDVVDKINAIVDALNGMGVIMSPLTGATSSKVKVT